MSLPTISFIGTKILTQSIVNSLLPEEQCNIIIEGYTSIGANAFNNKSQIVNVIISDSVTSISRFAFLSCTSLTSITLSNYITFIGVYAFQYCSSLESLILPNSLETIENNAFESCSSLESIIIPNSVTFMGSFVFANCTSLISVILSNSCIELKNNLFTNCSSLTSITIPSSITTIKSNVFENCSSLTAIPIPVSVTFIGARSFISCNSLESIIIPNSVNSINEYAFQNCSKLTTIVIQNPTKIANIFRNSFPNVSTNPASSISFGNISDSGYNGLSSIWKTISTYNATQIYLPQNDPTIIFPDINVTYGDTLQNFYSSDSEGSITLTSSNTSVAIITGTEIFFVGAGTSNITLFQAETDEYFAGTSVALCTVLENTSETPGPINNPFDLIYYFSESDAIYGHLSTSVVITGNLIANGKKVLTVDENVTITKSTKPI